jgi:methyl-accepting chemotaxis protein
VSELSAASDSAGAAARDAVASSGRAEAAADQGTSVVADAIRAMDGIKRSSEELARITGVVDDIAFQTYFLALNAGTEAARAGSAGRGFAVVATEVRALAQRSSAAARDISDLIARSAPEIEGGVELVRRTRTALEDISDSTVGASARTRDISEATVEKGSALREIASAMADPDRTTQHNAALVQETTDASTALRESVRELLAVTSRFRLREGTAAGHRREVA